MDWIEVTARTVDDAKELALDRLGVVEDELEFEVLDEPRGGLFRRSDARIRARVKPLSREKPVDRRRRRRGGERQGTRGSGGREGREGRERTPTAVADEEGAGGKAPGNGAGADRPRSRRRRGRGGGSSSGGGGGGRGRAP